MAGIIGIIAFLTVLGLSLLITKIATAALAMTGLSEQAARFQARSAFTGTGFTTEEAEKVVNHPVRRRIVMILMILRSAGLVTIVISLILSLKDAGRPGQPLYRLIWIAGGVVMLWLLAMSKTVDKYLGRVIQKALARWTQLDTRDYANLLHLAGEYSVMELRIDEDDWLSGKDLRRCDLHDEGVTVLGINRADGGYIGVPHGKTEIYPGDVLILYGRSEGLQELSERRSDPAGDQAHDRAVGEQQQQRRRQDAQEEFSKRRRSEQADDPGHSV